MKYSKEYTAKVKNAKENDIVDVIKSYGISLEKKNDQYIGECPFDKKGIKSLVVFPDQTFHCFEPKCGASGNVFVFVMKMEGCSFDEAIDKLAQRAHISPTEQDFRIEEDTVTIDNLKKAYHDAATFYVNKLKSEDGKNALSYLKDRMLDDKTITSFGLGYAPQKGNVLYKYMKTLGYSDELLLQAGLIKMSDKGAYDFFRNRVMFPIVNANNDVVAFSGRVMDDGKPKYLNSPESLIFNKSNTFFGMNKAKKYMEATGKCLICEGQMDVIKLHQAGFRNAIAPMGTAMTQAHIPFLTDKVNTVLLTSDSDAAGQKAMARAIRLLSNYDMNIRVVDMTPCKDPDEFINAFGKEEYNDRIKTARDANDFTIKHLSEKFDLTDKEQKEKYLQEAVSAIIEMNDRKERLKEKEIERK